MNGRLPVAAIAAAGLGMGVSGDLLLRAPGGPGLNFTLLFAALAASVLLVGWVGEAKPSPEGTAWLAVGVAFGSAMLWRGSEVLRLGTFVAAATAFALPAFHAGAAWVRKGRVGEVLESLASAGVSAGVGVVRLFLGDGREVLETVAADGPHRTVARSVLGGLLLAGVPLAVFGALFVSADPVFAGIAADLVRVDLETVASHVAVTAILSWLAAGYLTGFWAGTRLEVLDPLRRARPSFRIGEIAVALGLVDLLFLSFVGVQFGALFGGAAWVEATPGLTYASYAREGFFQLVAATALGLPWLLAAESLLGDRTPTSRWVFRGLAGTQVVLLLAIVASAVVRMRAYVDAYGLTEDRIVATAVLGWLTLVTLWFGATVLRGRSRSFAFGGLAGAFALVASLLVMNPAAMAATDQLDRRAGAAAGGAPVDGEGPDARYLASLGSDATPILVARLHELDDEGRCLVARRLLDRRTREESPDWRNWNRADRTARAAVDASLPALQAAAGVGEECR